MHVTCEECRSKFNIPDEKIPEGKSASLRCPKCKSKITLESRKPAPPVPDDDLDDYDAGERPFDFMEEEEKTALLCEQDVVIREQIVSVLDMFEYHITVCNSARDAMKKMRYHIYDLVVVNEDFDSANPDANGILIYLERLNMAIRRNVFVLMISSRFHTMDQMMAFNKSVDVILNPEHIADFEKVLKRGLTQHDLAYRVYRETLNKLGRA